MNEPQPSAEHLNILRKYFGHNQFRPMQWKIIHSLLEKKQDNCVIMATGYGKSLCYQYPAVYANGLSIVISPLISLMQDQVLSLQMSNIPACYFGSAQTSKMKSLEDILNGDCRVLYITPEWITSNDNRELLLRINRSVKVTVIAIDEAHCVSQWGHDFRTSYRQLGTIIRNVVNNVPILAVTATATPQVRFDICRSLMLKNPQVICTEFDRPNLYFAVSPRTNDVFADIEKFLIRGAQFTYKFPGPTIIYCPTKKQTEKVAEELNSHGIHCAAYHADLPLSIRQSVHQKFVKGQLQVVVATVAFGMGIDKPDVRCVIHYGAPKEIESYYQEVGRAGRDGLPSTCHVFYSSTDFSLQRYFMNTGSTDQMVRQHRERMIRLMQQFLETRDCRRLLLLCYFGDNNKQKTLSADCCDNCTKQLKTGKTSEQRPKLEIEDEAKHLLKVIHLFKGRFGLTIPIKFLRGMNEPKIPQYLLKHELYGSGKAHSEAAWKALGRLCLREGLTQEISCTSVFQARKMSFPVSTVAVTAIGEEFIKIGEKCGVVLVPNVELESLFRKKLKLPIENEKSNYWGSKLEEYKNTKQVNKEREQQAALFSILKKLRDTLAMTHDCSPYMVASDLALHTIAVNKPLTLSDLASLNVNGFNEAKLEKFGNQIIQKIREFCGESTNTNNSEVQFENDDVFDMMTDGLLKNVPDYSNAKVSINQYQAEEEDSPDFKSRPTKRRLYSEPNSSSEFPGDDITNYETSLSRTNPINRMNQISNHVSKNDANFDTLPAKKKFEDSPTEFPYDDYDDLMNYESSLNRTNPMNHITQMSNYLHQSDPSFAPSCSKFNGNLDLPSQFPDDDSMDYETSLIATNPLHQNHTLKQDDDDSTDFEDSPIRTKPISINTAQLPEDDDLTDFEASPIRNKPDTCNFLTRPNDDVTDSVKSSITVEPEKPSDDYWGNISDELFESVPLDDISNPVNKPVAQSTTSSSTGSSKNTKSRAKLQFESDSNDDTNASKSTTSVDSLSKFGFHKLNENVPQKRELPSWLTQPAAKLEIKKRVKSNSLFKK